MAEMDKKLYDLMDWEAVDEIVYSESENPHRILGAHATAEGLLVQEFFPTAKEVKVRLENTGKTYAMELADEAGFFAALSPRNKPVPYTRIVT